MTWIATLVALLGIGTGLVVRDQLRTKKQRRCPCCGSRELIEQQVSRQRRGVFGIHWSCTQCREPLFEPSSVSFPKDYPGPLTAEQHDAHIDGFELPAARALSSRAPKRS